MVSDANSYSTAHSGCLPSSLERAAQLVAAVAIRHAPQHDQEGSFPEAEIESLHHQGLLLAPFPEAYGGCALGVTASSTAAMRQVLRTIGASSLPLGRLYEGHVNAVRLVVEYGHSGTLELLLKEVGNGRVSGVWNAEKPPGLRLDRNSMRLMGSKIYCSGAGFIGRPVVTAATAEGILMMLPDASSAVVDSSLWKPTGMRASITGTVHFDGIVCDNSEIVGSVGDYYRSPLFATGAWRVLAVQLGALDKLVALFRDGLFQRDRYKDQLHRARFGRAYAKLEGARLWTTRAALIAEDRDVPPDERDSVVNLARGAFERAALDILELIQRSLGLGTMIHPDPIERIARDLTTYLRQPFPDGALDASAGWLLENERDIHKDLGDR